MRQLKLNAVKVLIFMAIIALYREVYAEVYSEELPNKKELKSDQVIGNLEGKKNLYLPQSYVVPHLEIMDGKLKENIERARAMLGKKNVLENRDINGDGGVESADSKVNVVKELPVANSADEKVVKVVGEVKEVKKSKVRVKEKQKEELLTSNKDGFKDLTNGVRIFPGNLHYLQEVTGVATISLPAGSTAMGTVLAGVEVSATDSKKTYATLDYAFIGPNQSIVELKDCMVWMSVNANYTTERIYGEVNTISCRAPNGKTFTVNIKGHLIDQQDQYIGAKGELLTRGKILGAALMFLRDATQEFGKAMASAQIKTEISEGNGPFNSGQKAENVTGSQSKYVLGKSSQAAVATFLNWWIDFYMGLSPTICYWAREKGFFGN